MTGRADSSRGPPWHRNARDPPEIQEPDRGAIEMITRSVKRLSMRALIVDDELGTPTAEGRAARALVQEMQGRTIEVIEANSAEDGTSVFTSDSAIHAVLMDWTLGDDRNHAKARRFLEFVRSR